MQIGCGEGHSYEHLRTMVKAILRKQRQAPEKKSWGPFGFFLSAAFLIQPFTDRIKGYNEYAIAEKAHDQGFKTPKFISAVKEGKTKNG